MMLRHIELRSRMTLGANRIAGQPQFLSVRLVTGPAGHARGVLAALHVGAPDEYLVLLPPVRMIETLGEYRRQIMIHQWIVRQRALGQLRAPRMTGSTRVDLGGIASIDLAAIGPRRRDRVL